MSLFRLLPAWLHAVADYAVGFALVIIALSVNAPGKAKVVGVGVGVVVLLVSLLTRYPLGLLKILPFRVHSAGDYLAAVLLVAGPFALGFASSARALTIVYVAAGTAVLLVSLITNYQYGTDSSPILRASPAAAEPTLAVDPGPLAAVDPGPLAATAVPERHPGVDQALLGQEALGEEIRGQEAWRRFPDTVSALDRHSATTPSTAIEPATRGIRPGGSAAITKEEVLAQMEALRSR